VTRDGEVVLIMGLPAAGKSTVARSFVEQGYTRLNRDEAGGTLKTLVPAFDRLVTAGATRIVLDNTYVSRQSRRPVIEAAAAQGLSVRGIWLDTSIEDAQVNAVRRMLSRYGRLLDVSEMRERARHDPAVFGPLVQFRYERACEPPDVAEGFASIETQPFIRRPAPDHHSRALVIWCDGVLWSSNAGHRAPRGAEDAGFVDGRDQILRRYAAEGWSLIGLSWLPDIADGRITRDDALQTVDRLASWVGTPIDVAFCPHGAGPPECWCRKPMPGLGVLMIDRHRLDPAACLFIGEGPQDPGFARRLGMEYRSAMSFFEEGATEL
jgi:predicted kinase